jgi:putative membrane protein
MSFLDAEEKKRIAAAIRSVEAKTAGELVTVIARESDPYRFIPTLWAALLALLVPVVAWLLAVPATVPQVATVQLALFCCLAILGRWRWLKYRLIPGWVKADRTKRRAREQFFDQRVRDTAGGTGILIFVSVGERYVEILADRGIDERVDRAVWQRIVDDFVARVREGRVAEGFLAAIDECGAILAVHCPRNEADANERPDRLVEI